MNLGLQTVSDDHYVNHQFLLSVAINSVVIGFVLSVESWHLAVQWVMSLSTGMIRRRIIMMLMMMILKMMI